jgi:holliday junction DNA helicase RuvA
VIGSLEGQITHKRPPNLLLEVAGVGYEIEAPMSTFLELPAAGSRVRLLTHLVVREDAHILYGFATSDERGLFRALLKVSGVGPRIALALLSGVTVPAFARCVREKDLTTLTRVPGIGRKIAERLIVEMRDRVDGTVELVAGQGAGTSGAQGEAWSALVALGYKPPEATRMLNGVGSGTTEELIRRALQSVDRD